MCKKRWIAADGPIVLDALPETKGDNPNLGRRGALAKPKYEERGGGGSYGRTLHMPEWPERCAQKEPAEASRTITITSELSVPRRTLRGRGFESDGVSIDERAMS